MNLSLKKYAALKWVGRVSAAVVAAFGLPFYFGYGNPLPFMNPEFSFLDNVWMIIFPLMFAGLGLGWKFEKAGGFLISVPILIGFIINLILDGSLPSPMIVPLIIGLLYLAAGFLKKSSESD